MTSTMPKKLILFLTGLLLTGCATQSEYLDLGHLDTIVPIDVFATDIKKVDGLAMDQNNNLYATSENLFGSVVKVANNGEVENFKGLIIRADGLAFGEQNKLYVSSENHFGKIFQITSSGQKTVLLDKIKNPEGIAFDKNGYLFIAEDHPKGSILKYKDGKLEHWVTNLNRPENIAFDNFGHLYVTETGTDRILRIDSTGKQTVFVGPGIIRKPDGIAYCDSYEGVFVTEDSSKGNLYFIDLKGAITRVVSGFKYPQGVVCNKEGDLFISEQGRDRILKISNINMSRLF